MIEISFVENLDAIKKPQPDRIYILPNDEAYKFIGNELGGIGDIFRRIGGGFLQYGLPIATAVIPTIGAAYLQNSAIAAQERAAQQAAAQQAAEIAAQQTAQSAQLEAALRLAQQQAIAKREAAQFEAEHPKPNIGGIDINYLLIGGGLLIVVLLLKK